MDTCWCEETNHGTRGASCGDCYRDYRKGGWSTVDDALAWADANCTPEAMSRLRSRTLMRILADEVKRLRRVEEKV